MTNQTEFLAYTIFSDLACTQVRQIVQVQGEPALRLLSAFRNIKGFEPKQNDIIAGCRIDRIGSECVSEAA
jgi:hypothetical protein